MPPPIPNPSAAANGAAPAAANAGEGSDPSPSPVSLPLAGRGRAAAGPALSAGVEGAKPTARYSLHDLVRLFASSHLPDAERATAQYQHAAYYEQVLRHTRELYKQGNDFILQGLALFDREWINIQAGQQWAAANAQDNEKTAQLCSAYPDAGAYVLTLRLHPRDYIHWLQDALAAARQLKNRAVEGAHLGNLGLAYADLDETRKAIEYHLEFCDQLTVQLRMAIIQFNIHRHHIFFSALTKRTHLVPAASRPALSVGQVVTAMSHAFGRLHSGGPRSFVLPERTQTPPFGGPRLAKTSVSYELGAVIERSLFVFWCLLKSVPPDRKTQVISRTALN